MKRHRALQASPLTVREDLLGFPLASPARRVTAFVLDVLLLLLPSVAVAAGAAALALWFSDPAALRGLTNLISPSAHSQEEVTQSLRAVAPLLVRAEATGLPASVVLAVENEDLEGAAAILSDYTIDIAFSLGSDPSPVAPGHVRLEVQRLLPRGLRSAALLGIAALYFTFFASGARMSTLGKRVFGIAVRRLDGRPLTWWESFERFGGYLASLGTGGLGLLDFWKDPNRRLAHDRIANTVVLARARPLDEAHARSTAPPPDPDLPA